MAKKHFSLPIKVLEWIEQQAKDRGMRRSTFLTYLLLNVMEQEQKAPKE